MEKFDKNCRLLKKREFDYVFSQAKRVVFADFVFLFRKNSCGFARLGIALAKKNIKKAHDRNRMKRVIRETFRVTNLPAIDVIVLARSSISNAYDRDFHNTLRNAWQKILA